MGWCGITLPKYSIDNLTERLKEDIAKAKEKLETIEEALRSVKNPTHTELWKSYKENVTQHLERLKQSLKKITGSN